MTEHSEGSGDSGAGRDNGAERWLLAEARKIRGLLASIIALAAGIGLLVVFQARLLASACQRVVMQGEGVASVLPLAGVLVLLAAGRSIFWKTDLRQLLPRSSGRYAANCIARYKPWDRPDWLEMNPGR